MPVRLGVRGEGRAAAPRAESAAAPRAESAKAPPRGAARSEYRTERTPLSERETSLYGFRMARRIFDTQIHKVHTQGLEQGRK